MLLLIGLVLALAQQPADPPVRDNLSLEGTVRDQSGALFTGVLVLLLSPDRPLRVTLTNESGRYRLSGLTSGKYKLFMHLPGFAKVKASVEVAASVNHDEVLQLLSSETCACVTASPDPTIPDRLQSAMSRLHQVTLRMEDLKSGAVLDEQRRELLSDFRWLNISAVPALGDALRETNRQARLNAVVVLFDLSSGNSERKPVDISGLFYYLAQAVNDSDATLSEYARATLESALK